MKMVALAQIWKMGIPVHVKMDSLGHCVKQVILISIYVFKLIA